MKNFNPQSSEKSTPFLAALEADFYHPGDRRKWKVRCALKRQICRGFAKLGLDASNGQLARFLAREDGSHVSVRTIERGVAMLKEMGLVSNVRRTMYNGPMLRKLHPELLGKFRECGGPTSANVAVPLGECGGIKSPLLSPQEVSPTAACSVCAVSERGAAPATERAEREGASSVAVSRPENSKDDAELRSTTRPAFTKPTVSSFPYKKKAKPSRADKKRKLQDLLEDKIRKGGNSVGDYYQPDDELLASVRLVLKFVDYHPRDVASLSCGFVETLVEQYEKHPSKSPGRFSCEVMDALQAKQESCKALDADPSEYFWPRDFQDNRDRLREREKELEDEVRNGQISLTTEEVNKLIERGDAERLDGGRFRLTLEARQRICDAKVARLIRDEIMEALCAQ